MTETVPDEYIDPSEPRYCVCGDVSWGTMIPCDNDDCEKEYFHQTCVGLEELPPRKTKWYCPDCRKNSMTDWSLSAVTVTSLYPSRSKATLKSAFVGMQIQDCTPTPLAIVDAAVVRRNCRLMLETTQRLGVGFRAHVKTHKTTEIARLQVGEETKSVKLVCSTVAEIESLLPWLLECKKRGREVNVLYGLPVVLSAIPRLATLSRKLGVGSVGLFADHPAHIRALDQVDEATWPGEIPVWVNIDVGDHREGIAPESAQLADVAYGIAASKRVRLAGLYTHLSASYRSSSPEEALRYMATELEGLQAGAVSFLKCTGAYETKSEAAEKVVLSLGATPTATATQNLFDDTESAVQYRAMIEKISQSFAVEIHAGVYPVMDMQQMATRARPQNSLSIPTQTLLSYGDLGLRIMVEVASLYLDRTDKPEALIATGTVALGREPCKSYDGWAVVTPWPARTGDHYDPEGSKTGWIVGRISQEHGVLTWEGPRDNVRQLEIGERLLLWPNHACIAGISYGWYLIVDSDTVSPDEIKDVWVRWRGW